MIVIWRVTQHCNLSCAFCGYARDLDRPRADADPVRIAAFGSVLADYQRTTGDPVLVSWLGGEPLRWAPLRKLTRTFRALGLSLSATTNGSMLGSRAVRAHALECYEELTISVDGIEAMHDRLRGWPGGYAALHGSVSSLADEKRCAGAGPKLRANVVLMRDNIGEFEALCLELARWGIEEISFNQLGGNDRPEFFPEHRLLSEQADWLAEELPELRFRLAALGVRLDGTNEYLRRIRATTRSERLPVADCRPGERFLFIDEAGQVAPCSFTTSGYGIRIDEVTSANAVAELPFRFNEARKNNPLAPCEDCHSTQVFQKFET